MKGQDNPLIPNPHPHLLNSIIKKPIIVPSSYQHKKTHKPRKAIRTTEISQSSGPINLVADETVYKEWEDRMERAATTASSLDAEQDSGSGPRCHVTILGDADAQTRIEAASKQSNDPPLSRGYTLGSGEDSMKLLELMELCTKLSDLVNTVTAAGLLTTVRHNIVLPVQVNAAEGDFINTSIQGFIRFFIRFQSFKRSLNVNPNSISSLIIKKLKTLSTYFLNTHNMVVFLEKLHEIIDFLNANQIHYALTVNPTIYTSCIEQFWATAKVKTVNGERQIQALVDKKKVIITETSIRSDLHLEYADGTDCLPTATIFKERARMGRKQKKNTEVPHPSDSTANVPNEEHVHTHSNNPLLSGEDRMKLIELMNMYTKLSKRVLDLEHTKTAQAQEITNMKLGVKKLEKKAGFKTHNFKRLYKVGVTRRVESSDDESLGAQEDASKQGRSKIEAIDRDVEVTLVETQRRNDKNDDNLMFDTGVFDGNEIVVETEEPVINAATTTKSIPVSTDEIDLAQEITLAQALAAMKSAKPKEKDVVQESSENVITTTTMVSTATTTVVATPVITTPPQQRAKGIAFREPVDSTVTTTVPS
ncbi:hypothetical protein Tco_0196065 [Tanacetum coccineum]